MRGIAIAHILSAACFDALAAAAAQSPVTLRYDPPPALVLHQPVVVEFRVDNSMAETIYFDLGLDKTEAFSITIRQPDGTTLQPRLPAPTGDGPHAIGRVSLTRGASYSQRLLLNLWSSFEQVGVYHVQIAMSAPIATGRGEILHTDTSHVMPIEIGAQNEDALDQICSQLAQTAMSVLNVPQFYDAARLLTYVNDPVGFRYMRLVLAATERVDDIILPRLYHINSAEARGVLMEAAETGSEERARRAGDLLRSLERRR